MTSRRKWLWRGAAALGAVIVSVAAWAACQRYLGKNFHAVIEGHVYRSAQPTPEDLRAWKEKYGLRSVLTLQGWSGTRAVVEEKKAAEAMGLRHAYNYLSSDRLPSPAEAIRLYEVMAMLPRPLLIHCRGGAERTGMASVLAAMSIGGQDFASATSQLSMRYLRIPRPGPDVNDLFDAYESHRRKSQAALGGWTEFRAWLETVYKPSYYSVLIDVPPTLSGMPGATLTVRTRITNTSYEAIPVSSGRAFDLIALVNEEEAFRSTKDVWGRVALPRQDLPPGGTLEVVLPIRMPAETGTTVLCFDLEEVGNARFAVYGSPRPTCTVTVK